MVAKKDTNLAAHPDLPSVPNLQVMKAMQVSSIRCTRSEVVLLKL